MRKFLYALVGALAILMPISAAQAHSHHHHRHHVIDANGNDARPAEWCGWFMRAVEHVKDEAYNSSLKWLHYGTPASGPAVGEIVVWNHGRGKGHVGKIVGRTEQGWIVLSGNDGHRVRRRVRNVNNAAGFRRPPGSNMLTELFDGR